MFFLAEHDSGYSYILSQSTLIGEVEDTVFGKSSDSHILFSDFKFSPDRKHLLLETDYEPLYRGDRGKHFICFIR